MGAALAQVSGSFDRVLANLPREEALAQAKGEAVEAAVRAGADKDTVQIIDVSEVALAYLPGEKLLFQPFLE